MAKSHDNYLIQYTYASSLIQPHPCKTANYITRNMFTLPYEFFGSHAHSLTFTFAPFSEEMCVSIECLLLAETCHAFIGVKEGPIPNFVLFAPWNEYFPNSSLYPAQHSYLSFANYWQTFISFFYQKTQHQPLPLLLLYTIKRDLLIMIEKKLNQSCYCSYKASIFDTWNGTTTNKITYITFTRPYFEVHPIPTPLGNNWLNLRETFDRKPTPANDWSNETYLSRHMASYDAFIRNSRPEENSAHP